MLRSTVAVAALIAVAGSATLAGAAGAQEIRWDSAWTAARPDALPPAGVTYGHTLDGGNVEVGYRFGYAEMGNFLIGDSLEFTPEELLGSYDAVPFDRWRQVHELFVLFAANDRFTARASVPFVITEADYVTAGGGGFSAESSGLGDPSVGLMMRLWREGALRGHLSADITLPIGDTDETDLTPSGQLLLPYPMQVGSGTWDITPGATVTAMNQRGVFGAQLLGTFRIGENGRGYNLGDRIQAQIWMAPRFTDYISASIRVVWQAWENVEGFEEDFNNVIFEPAAFAEAQGGQRWDVPIGINLFFPEGPFAGHRLSLEAVFPVHHDLDGPQQEMDWGFVASWQTMFGWDWLR